MKKKILSFIGMAAFAGAVAFNISANIDKSTATEQYLSLSTIEIVAIGGCEASATNCSASCSDSMYCFSYANEVNCDGNWTSC